MRPRRVLSVTVILFVLAIGTTVLTAQDGATTNLKTAEMPAKIQTAIDASLEDPEQAAATRTIIDPTADQGLFGVPGAPNPSYVVGFFWAIWVGWIFSTVGAFGGIMAGVGHITIFGLGDYAKGFGKGHPMNKLLTDSIRVSNQWLVGLSALISSTNYLRMGQLVLPIAVSLGVGSVAGSFLIPRLTAGQINLKDYIGIFGLIVLALGVYLFYQTTPKGQASMKEAKAAAEAFEQQSKEVGGSEDQGVKVVKGSYRLMFVALALVIVGALWGNLGENLFGGAVYIAYGLVVLGLLLVFLMPEKDIRFTFCGVEFGFKAHVPAVGGVFIAAMASFLGIGGGFLLVPFLTTAAGLPMFLVAGTSAFAVLVGMTISIFTYMVGKGVVVPWILVGVEMIGIFIGSMIGPRTQKYIPDVWLKRLFVVLAIYVGLRYCSKGFLGYSILPPF